MCMMGVGVSERFVPFPALASGRPDAPAYRKAMLFALVPLTSGLALYLVLTSLLGGGHESREHSQNLNCLGLRGKAFSAICPFPTMVPLMARPQDEGEEGVGSLGEECSRQKDQPIHSRA